MFLTATKRLFIKKCVGQDMFEEGPTPVLLYRLAAHYDGEG